MRRDRLTGSRFARLNCPKHITSLDITLLDPYSSVIKPLLTSVARHITSLTIRALSTNSKEASLGELPGSLRRLRLLYDGYNTQLPLFALSVPRSVEYLQIEALKRGDKHNLALYETGDRAKPDFQSLPDIPALRRVITRDYDTILMKND